jgi:hypothetical protein
VRYQPVADLGPDPFSPATDVRASAAASKPGAGPFGGTGSDVVCDRELLIRSLAARTDRLREWARVMRLAPTEEAVGSYIRALRPATLTRDTRVTNHSFKNGRAMPYQAVLQEGTAVLVDASGRPVVRCRCGNPLLEPVLSAPFVCRGCPPAYRPPPPCRPAESCYRPHPSPPPVTTEAPSQKSPPYDAGGWTASARELRGKEGERFPFRCPPGAQPGTVWGTGPYTDDSSVCTAAVHSGKVTLDDGGTVTIEIRPGEDSYSGSRRKGIETLDFGRWDGSFVVVR